MEFIYNLCCKTISTRGRYLYSSSHLWLWSLRALKTACFACILAPSPEIFFPAVPSESMLCCHPSHCLTCDVGAGAHLQPFQAGCLAASCFLLCSCLCCLDFSVLLILSHIPGVCTHSQVPLVPGERLGHHQVCQGGLLSSCSPPAVHQHYPIHRQARQKETHTFVFPALCH